MKSLFYYIIYRCRIFFCIFAKSIKHCELIIMKNWLLSIIAATFCCGCTAQGGSNVLSIEEYDKAIKADTTAVIIDVRQPAEYAEGHLSGASLLNVLDEQTFDKGIEKLDKAKTYYIYCRSGRRSQTATKKMQQRSLKVFDLKGGFNAWKAAGMPIEK